MDNDKIRKVIKSYMEGIETQYASGKTDYAKGNMQQSYVTATHIFWLLTHEEENSLFNEESLIYKDLQEDAEKDNG